MKTIVPANNFEIWNRLEVLLGLKPSGHSDPLTEASKLAVEKCQRGELQNE